MTEIRPSVTFAAAPSAYDQRDQNELRRAIARLIASIATATATPGSFSVGDYLRARDGHFRGGISIGQLSDPYVLATDHLAGGSLAANDYEVGITSLDALGNESFAQQVTVTGVLLNEKIEVDIVPIAGAVSYRTYLRIVAGAWTDTGDVDNTFQQTLTYTALGAATTAPPSANASEGELLSAFVHNCTVKGGPSFFQLNLGQGVNSQSAFFFSDYYGICASFQTKGTGSTAPAGGKTEFDIAFNGDTCQLYVGNAGTKELDFFVYGGGAFNLVQLMQSTFISNNVNVVMAPVGPATAITNYASRLLEFQNSVWESGAPTTHAWRVLNNSSNQLEIEYDANVPIWINSSATYSRILLRASGSVEHLLEDTTGPLNRKYIGVINDGGGLTFRFYNDDLTTKGDYLTISAAGAVSIPAGISGTVPASAVTAGTFGAGAYTFSSTVASTLTVSSTFATAGDQTLALFSAAAASQNSLFRIHNTDAAGAASVEVGATAAGAIRARLMVTSVEGYVGTFSAHPFGFIVSSSARWWMNTSFHFYPAVHNSYDLGLSGTRVKDGWFQGTVTATTFSGSGASLTTLNATNLSSGTVAMARLLTAGGGSLSVMASYARAADAVDVNTLLESGTYGIHGTMTNGPSGASSYGTMLVQRNATDVLTQIHVPRVASSFIYYRGATNGGSWTFGSWQTIVDAETTQTISGAKSFSTFIALSNVAADKKLQFQRTGGNQHSIELGTSGIGLYNETTALYRWWVSNAGDVGLGTTGIANGAKLDVVGKIRAGSAGSTSGTVVIESQYSNGAIALWGTNYSSGGPIMAYGVKPSTAATNVFVSSTGIAAVRGAFSIDGNVHRWFTAGAQTVAIDGAITMTETMSLTDGALNLSAGTVFQVSGTKVVGAQGAAVADATDAASVITQLNALLARVRSHGLIST